MTGQPLEKFSAYMVCKKCRSIMISGISDLCADGEITGAGSIEITPVPAVVRLAT